MNWPRRHFSIVMKLASISRLISHPFNVIEALEKLLSLQNNPCQSHTICYLPFSLTREKSLHSRRNILPLRSAICIVKISGVLYQQCRQMCNFANSRILAVGHHHLSSLLTSHILNQLLFTGHRAIYNLFFGLLMVLKSFNITSNNPKTCV